MLRHRIYYGLKPFVPRSIRLGIRRWFAIRKREQVRDIWPIMPASERVPDNWLGWANGKQFALVLTHDVEDKDGLGKCRELMRLEQELGFRSSFNFIPEGNYKVPSELRDELVSNGFEVGIHDLKHDGRLFVSRREFSRKAIRINGYLRDWNAAGFRSGFMLHKLDWLHELDIQYDASTFDTDPFEPQPEGRHTIFPFWVPAPAARKSEANSSGTNNSSCSTSGRLRAGYVELPYTLPQDFTLFLLLREQTPDIWLRKIDWIAKHGGMALVNVHPDYLCFDGAAPKAMEYPSSHYKALLDYVKERYEGLFWHTTPRKVAQFFAKATKVPAQASQS
jgi:peptidoglycan/xylan/chitin deacetylase (PgdA/CDA1 family)